VIDTTKTKATGANAVTMVGHGAVYDGTNQWQAEVYALSSTVLGVRLVNPSTGGDWGSTNAPLNSSGLQFSFDISLPISGWSATDIVTPESSISGQARYTTNTAQSISNGTATVIDFEDKVYDINSEVTTGAWKFTAKTSGYYQVNARILFDTSSDWEAGELAGLYIFKNGVAQTYADGKVADAAVSQYMPASVSDVIYLDVGQYIEIKAYQNSDNSRTLIADGKYNTVSISKVTGPGSQSFYISSPLVAAPDGTGIKLKSSTYTDLMTGTDSGTFIIGASSGTTDGHTARANTSIPFKIKNNDATGSFAQFANSGGTLGYVGHDTTGFRVYASNGSTAWASTDTSGNWTMLGNVTSTGGNFVPGTSGKGVDFSANTHASGMTSEVLTRYEEGTWTPVVEGSTVSGTATYGASGQVGRYTRVGRLVTIHGYVDLDNLTGATGTMLISGLPFAQINTVSMYAHCAQFDFLSFTTTASNSTPGGFVTPNYSKITIINVPNNGPSTTAQSASAGDFDFSLWFTCTYTAQ
jgi:hypothetical protein